ncbi:MAG: signal peptidase I [Bacteroidetes bacterium]|nr:signal peptidase I [Bacteroidota bacterium]
MIGKLIKIASVVIVILVIAGYSIPFSGKAFKMASISMQPAINKGDRVFANFAYYSNNKVERGDIVVFKYPEDPKKLWIKRIIAFGGETVEIRDGNVLINSTAIDQKNIKTNNYTNAGKFGGTGNRVLVPEESYFVLGDNSEKSLDSRYFGFLPKNNVVAKITQRYWPLNKMGNVE